MFNHSKVFGIYYFDQFNHEASLVGESNNLDNANQFIFDNYGSRICATGANQVAVILRSGKEMINWRVT